MWKLVIVDDEQHRTVVNLVRDEYVVGRAGEHAVCLTERNISRTHARITRTRYGFRLEDLSSYNGSFVNGVRVVGRQDLAHGDMLQLGDYRIHVLDEAIDTQEQGYKPFDGSAVVPASGRLPHRLVELIGPQQGAEYPLDGERFLIGRGTECEFVIDHGSVSRIHAEVHRISEDRFEIIDKGSANGLRINGHELNRALLDGRDVIEIGDVVLKYIAQGQVFRASADESARIAALADTHTPLNERQQKGSGVAAGLMAAAVGAMIVGAIFLATASPDESNSDEPNTEVREASPLPNGISEAASLLEQGELVQAGRVLASRPANEKHDSRYAELEQRWAQASLKALSELDEAQQTEIFEHIATSDSLAPELRQSARDKLKQREAAKNQGEEAVAAPQTVKVAPAPRPEEPQAVDLSALEEDEP